MTPELLQVRATRFSMKVLWKIFSALYSRFPHFLSHIQPLSLLNRRAIHRSRRRSRVRTSQIPESRWCGLERFPSVRDRSYWLINIDHHLRSNFQNDSIGDHDVLSFVLSRLSPFSRFRFRRSTVSLQG